MNKYHPNLTPDRWSAKPKAAQILNIAAEFSRAKHWLNQNDADEAKKCLNRAFELLDLTIEDPKWSRGLKELLRLRGALADFYIQHNLNVPYFNLLFRTLLNFDGRSALVKI